MHMCVTIQQTADCQAFKTLSRAKISLHLLLGIIPEPETPPIQDDHDQNLNVRSDIYNFKLWYKSGAIGSCAPGAR